MDISGTQIHNLIALQTLHEEMPETAWQVFKWIHVALTIVALLVNCASLIVIYGLVSKLTPPLQFLSCLSFTQLLAPWAVVTTYFPHTSCQEEIHISLLLAAHNTAALTLLSLALSHTIATFKPFRYERIVTPKIVWISITVIWLLALFAAHLHFIITLIHHNHDTMFCYQVYENIHITLIVTAAIFGLSLLGMVVSYGRIFLYLRPIGAFNNPNVNMPRKSTHGLVTGIILTAFHFIVWAPYIISTFEHLRVHNTSDGYGAIMSMFITMTFILINCIASPIIYSLRMDNITTGYSRMYYKLRGWVTSGWSRLKTASDREERPSDPLNPIESVC